MFDLVQKICYPGNPQRANEDIIGYGRNYFFAIDGASCLSGVNVMEQGSDAAWMVRQVKEQLCRYLDQEDPRPTREILRQIIEPIRSAYFDTLQSKGLHQPDDSPSAGMALFRQRAGKLEFFGLGDCVGVAALPDGSFFASLDTNLVELDNTVLERMLHLHRTMGMSIQEARLACNDMLLDNRLKRNRPGGYWILDLLSDEGLDNAREFSWELTGPVRAGAFSDGFAQLAEMFGIYNSYSELFAAMQTSDLNEMFAALCKAQDADPDCNDYPRFKLRDDTCALWGIFQ